MRGCDLLTTMKQTMKSLRTADFSDDQLRALPDEASAVLLFQYSAKLQTEFKTEERFLSYWRDLNKGPVRRMRLAQRF